LATLPECRQKLELTLQSATLLALDDIGRGSDTHLRVLAELFNHRRTYYCGVSSSTTRYRTSGGGGLPDVRIKLLHYFFVHHGFHFVANIFKKYQAQTDCDCWLVTRADGKVGLGAEGLTSLLSGLSECMGNGKDEAMDEDYALMANIISAEV
jgi:hypothetical protein